MLHADGVADEDRRGNKAERERDPSAEPDSASILLIEDDVDLRDTMVTLLERAGYRVSPHTNALAALLEMESQPPDLVLLDLMMPGMNGWQFRVQQRGRPQLADIPVIAISADRSEQAAAIDADAFVQKPFDFDKLALVIERVLMQRARRRMLAKSVELERANTLGMLVARVVHEVNNPLGYVMAQLELMQRRLDKLAEGAFDARTESNLREGVSGALDGLGRIAHIMKVLSTFSRPISTEPPKVIEVTSAIEAAARLAILHIRPRAMLQCDLSPVPPVYGHEAPLAQVLLNLLVNAAQAIPEGESDRGCINVRTFRDGDEVVIEVRDNGAGIPREVLPRVFESFYTTKPAGQGTGLGLSISREIIESFGGRIEAESSVGIGSAFRVCLRSASCGWSLPPQRSSWPEAGERYPRVLVIDDEPLIGSVLKSVLERFEVAAVTDWEAGLERLARGDVDLVLCDPHAPGLSRSEAYAQVLEVRPDLAGRCILMIDQSAHERAGDVARPEELLVLEKPFGASDVEDCVERALRRAPWRLC